MATQPTCSSSMPVQKKGKVWNPNTAISLSKKFINLVSANLQKNTHTHTFCNIYKYVFNQINKFIARNPTQILQLIIFLFLYIWGNNTELNYQNICHRHKSPDVRISGFPFVWKMEVQSHCYWVFCKTYGIIAVLTTVRAQKTNIFTNQGFHGDMVMQVWCYGGASVLT